MNRKKESFIRGASTEQAFVYAMNQAGKQVEVSSREQNIEDHIDFFVDGISVDVKGDRHLDCIWLELRNVNGKYGWLKGKAKYIVMDIKEMNGFVFFLRKDLLRYADQFKERTASKEDYYKLYTRTNRLDIIVKCKYDDIKHFKKGFVSYKTA